MPRGASAALAERACPCGSCVLRAGKSQGVCGGQAVGCGPRGSMRAVWASPSLLTVPFLRRLLQGCRGREMPCFGSLVRTRRPVLPSRWARPSPSAEGPWGSAPPWRDRTPPDPGPSEPAREGHLLVLISPTEKWALRPVRSVSLVPPSRCRQKAEGSAQLWLPVRSPWPPAPLLNVLWIFGDPVGQSSCTWPVDYRLSLSA